MFPNCWSDDCFVLQKAANWTYSPIRDKHAGLMTVSEKQGEIWMVEPIHLTTKELVFINTRRPSPKKSGVRTTSRWKRAEPGRKRERDAWGWQQGVRPAVAKLQVLIVLRKRKLLGQTERKMEVWCFVTWSEQMWAPALLRAWQTGRVCNARPDAKISVLVLIHHLQHFRLDSPRLLNHPQTHLEVITTVINSSINQTDLFLPVSLTLTKGICIICLIFSEAPHTLKNVQELTEDWHKQMSYKIYGTEQMLKTLEITVPGSRSCVEFALSAIVCPVWRVCDCWYKCWKYTAQSAQQRDSRCQRKRSAKREWRQPDLWRRSAYSTVIWPTCAHMCMTQPGPGSQSRPAPATLSSSLWFETRRQDADALKSAWEGVCVCVRVTMSAGLGQTWGSDMEERKRGFIFCGSDITGHGKNKMCSCEKKKKTQPWRLCVFRVTVRGHANKVWTVAGLASKRWLYFWEMESRVFLHKSSLFTRIYTILSAQRSMLLLDCHQYSTSAHTNRPVLAHTSLEVNTNVVCCLNHTRGKSAQWPW